MHIADARAVVLSELNGTGIDSFLHFIYFQPNVDTLSLTSEQFESAGALFDLTGGPNNWTSSSSTAASDGDDNMTPENGFIQFQSQASAVPEPGSLLMLGLLGACGIGYRGCRRFLKNRQPPT